MKQSLSTSLAPDTLYMDAQHIVLLVPEVGPGSVVGFEWEEERRPLSLEDLFDLQDRFPVLRARYSLSLPPGWTAEFSILNADFPEAKLNRPSPQTFLFELENIPAVVKEAYMPYELSVIGRLLFLIKPPFPDGRCFADWSDLGAWYEGLSREGCTPNEAVAAKAAQLTADINDSLGRIRALANFVQKEIRYVSIQIGIGGFKPHSAASVLYNRYGDCKDKAALLSSMLAAIGIESYLLLVHTERGFVSFESPVSLNSFNHALLAIRLPDDIPEDGIDALVHHSRLGSLLIFDPTIPVASLERLPLYLQDNIALLAADRGGELIRLPRPGPESNSLERTGSFILTAKGDLVGEIHEIWRGSSGDSLRQLMQASSESDRRKYLETFLSDSLPTFSLKNYEFHNLDTAQDDLMISYDLVAPAYANRAGGFVVVRPWAVGRTVIDLTSSERKPRRYPLDLGTTSLARDEFIFELPEELIPESLPNPVHLDAGFAVYRSATESTGRTLVYRREYKLVEPVLPANRFEEALEFYLAVGSEERQRVLLKSDDSRRP